jgi:site-specific recombinase XerD
MFAVDINGCDIFNFMDRGRCYGHVLRRGFAAHLLKGGKERR